MNEPGLSGPALTAGLLMEGAQSQQQLAAAALEALRAHTAGLDAVVRDEIHRTLVETLSDLHAEVVRVTRRLESVGVGSRRRQIRVGVALALLGAVMTAGAAWWLPSAARIAALEAREAALRDSLARLQREGAGLQLHRCGHPARLCVRIDTHAPHFGADGDIVVLAAE